MKVGGESCIYHGPRTSKDTNLVHHARHNENQLLIMDNVNVTLDR